jgi:hypothetical protein
MNKQLLQQRIDELDCLNEAAAQQVRDFLREAADLLRAGLLDQVEIILTDAELFSNEHGRVFDLRRMLNLRSSGRDQQQPQRPVRQPITA